MNPERFQALTKNYRDLRVAIVGDFCLDRYLEIDPAKSEVSLETGLPVHNVVNVRAQPGGAGTILNNLAALELGAIFPVGFCGVDGEGFELRQALAARPGVRLDFFLQTPERRTFTYCKPLVLRPGQPPEELNRLDSKNWTPTPSGLETQLMDALGKLIAVERVNALIFLEQVDLAETGVITTGLLKAIGQIAAQTPGLLLIGDSRRGLRNWPPIMFKMNVSELGVLTGQPRGLTLEEIQRAALALARQNGRTVFVTLSERGLLGASAHGQCELVPALPVRGPIDIVGAGDAVTANLAAALAAGAGLREALEIANTAASVVIHQLGTTGTANVAQIRGLLP